MEKISKSIVIDKSKDEVLTGVLEVMRTISFFENFTLEEFDEYTIVETSLKDWLLGKQVLRNISCKVKMFKLTKRTCLVRITVFFNLLNQGLFSRVHYKIFIYPLLRSELSSHAQLFKSRLERWT
jgi:hypothetical protein